MGAEDSLFTFALAALLTFFFYGYNKLVSSDIRGLSIVKGKGSVITSGISITLIEVIEGVSAECFGREGPSSPWLDGTVLWILCYPFLLVLLNKSLRLPF
jgi:hypothetical protein